MRKLIVYFFTAYVFIGNIIAQTVHFSYDANGNRTHRWVETKDLKDPAADTSDTDGELYLDEVKPGINNYRFIGPQHKAKSFATPAMEAGEEYNYQIELEAEG